MTHNQCSSGTDTVKKIVCHADGDRCLGCSHYRGETDKCEFAIPAVAATPVKRSPYWICCRCDAPLACAACGVEQPDDSEYYEKLVRCVAQQAMWQPIETAPFVSAKRYLIVNGSEIPLVGFRYYPDGPWYDEHGHEVGPLAWQELPSYSLPSTPLCTPPEGQ